MTKEFTKAWYDCIVKERDARIEKSNGGHDYNFTVAHGLTEAIRMYSALTGISDSYCLTKDNVHKTREELKGVEMAKPTLKEAQDLLKPKYDLQDSIEEQRERAEVVIDDQISENTKKMQEAVRKENMAKIEEYDDIGGIDDE